MERLDDSVLEWLLDPVESDPAIRWQVRRDLLDEPAAVWREDRSRVAEEGWGRALLDARDDDGLWAGGAFFPGDFSEALFHAEGQPWTATAWALQELCDLGVDPDHPRVVETVELVGRNARWEHDDQPFWSGEVEPCINGRTVGIGAVLGADVRGIVDRLLDERLDDGGWNCEAERGATVSSFDTTINVVEGLLRYERSVGGDAEVRAAREGGDGRRRGLLRRGRAAGAAEQ